MSHRKGLVFLFAIALALALPAGAQTLRLSLPDAIHRALSGGTQAELARSAQQRAGIAQREALGALLPQVEARLQHYSQSINLETFGFSLPGVPAIVGPFNVTDGQIAAAMQLFNLAALRRYEALREERVASRWDVEQTENDVAAAVARLYVLVQRADAQIAARQADVALFERLGVIAQDEFKAGTGTRLDVAQANVQRQRARQALLVAQNDRENARLALLNAIGADEGNALVLVDILAPPTTVPPLTPALERAHTSRPELQQAESRVREAQLNVSAARARRIGSISFDFEGDLSGNHVQDLRSTRRIGLMASVPLFQTDVQATIARAKLALHDAETARAQRQRDVEQDVRRSVLALENAEARVAVAQENVTVAEEALTVAGDRRAAGYGSPVEVDRAQDAYRQAHEDLVSATADAVAASYDFAHATGDIRASIPNAGTNEAPAGGTIPGVPPPGTPPPPQPPSVPPTPAAPPAVPTPGEPATQSQPAIPVQQTPPPANAPVQTPAPQPPPPVQPPLSAQPQPQPQTPPPSPPPADQSAPTSGMHV
jgi:outer membrane protein TolC